MSRFGEWPVELAALWEPARYKVAYGGRNGLKSWGFARALLVQAAQRPLRVLCAREVQRSIRESVYRLLVNQIELLGLGYEYPDLLQHELRGRNGSLFMFAGLSDQTAESIKSFEDVDKVWLEEARTVSDRSLDILAPTIRKPGSEIWVSFNPDLDTDPVYQRLVVNSPPRTILMPLGWQAADRCGWMSAEAKLEREHAEKTMAANDYANIWEGKPRAAAAGAIYTDEMAYLVENKRMTFIDYDPALKVHLVLDLGWNDAMGCALVQKHLNSLLILEYIEVTHTTMDQLSVELKKRPYNWGVMYLPHDGGHGNRQTGKTDKQRMEEQGWTVELTPNVPVEVGIRTTRETIKRMWLNRDKTGRLVECLRRYRRSINPQTRQPGAPFHDEFSHGADVARYISVNAPAMTNENLHAVKAEQPNHRYT